MKNILLILVVVLSFYSVTNGADNYNKIDVETVFEKEFTLDTNEVDTVVTGMFPIYCDSLSFVVEVVSADSMNTDGAKVDVDARIRYMTVRGTADTTAYANLTSAVVMLAAENNAKFGSTLNLPSAYKGSRARLEINAKNTNDGTQKIKIRIYAIKEWR